MKTTTTMTRTFLLIGLIGLIPACKKSITHSEAICTEPAYEHKEFVTIPMENQEYENTLIFDDAAEELIFEDDDFDSTNPTDEQNTQDLRQDFDDNDLFTLDEPDLEFEETPEQNELSAVVYFPYDKEAPMPDQEENLKLAMSKTKEIIKQGKKIACKGHSCGWGSRCRVRNMPLSVERSEWIANYLVQNGDVTPEEIKVFGVGSEEPIVFEHTKQAQSANRRVEIYALAA